MIQWLDLTNINQLSEIDHLSKSHKVLIFKHSTRCSISNMALGRLETKWDSRSDIKTFYLDLLKHRDVSNAIAERYHITHQSPQALIISNGTCILHQSHSEISAADLLAN